MSKLSLELRYIFREKGLIDVFTIIDNYYKRYAEKNVNKLKPFSNWTRIDLIDVLKGKISDLTLERVIELQEGLRREAEIMAVAQHNDNQDSDLIIHSPQATMKECSSTSDLALMANSLPSSLARRPLYTQSNSAIDLCCTTLDRTAQPLAHSRSGYITYPIIFYNGPSHLSPSPSIAKKTHIRRYRHKLCSSAPDILQIIKTDDIELALTHRAGELYRPPSAQSRHHNTLCFITKSTAQPSGPNFCPFQFNNSRNPEQLRRWSASSGYGTGSPASVSTSSSCEKLNYYTNVIDYEHQTNRHLRADSMGSEDDYNIKYRSLRSLSPDSTYQFQPIYDNTIAWDAFKTNFPGAVKQMEDRLQVYIHDQQENQNDKVQGINFIKQQTMDIAKDILTKSQSEELTCAFFLQKSDHLDRLVNDAIVRYNGTKEVSPAIQVIRKLFAIIVRPARLLECLEFQIDQISCQSVNTNIPSTTDGVEQFKLIMQQDAHIPYIMAKLNYDLSKITTETEAEFQDSPADINNEVKQPDEDDFEKIKTISKGAYGIVQLVRHKNTNRRFAMKKISKERMIQKKLVTQVYNERDILSFAQNPFVVGLWCTFTTKKYLCLVMEYVEGGDVATLIKNTGQLPVDMAKMYFAEAVLALEYIHSYGIIHRDLKPDNMLITAEGHIKLTDFGLSKIGLVTATATLFESNIYSKPQFQESTIWGTPDYIAPEVILNMPYDQAVDWWSMGVILYEMLCYLTPFTADSAEELFENITDENYEISWELDEALEKPPEEAQDLIKGLLRYTPELRLGRDRNGVKQHVFFDGVDWENLLRRKAEFIPALEGEEDTSYFDTREERYPEEYDSDDGDDFQDTDSSFARFSCTSHRYSKLLEGMESKEFEDFQQNPLLVKSPSLECVSLPERKYSDNRAPRVMSPLENRTSLIKHDILRQTSHDDEISEKFVNNAILGSFATTTHSPTSTTTPATLTTTAPTTITPTTTTTNNNNNSSSSSISKPRSKFHMSHSAISESDLLDASDNSIQEETSLNLALYSTSEPDMSSTNSTNTTSTTTTTTTTTTNNNNNNNNNNTNNNDNNDNNDNNNNNNNSNNNINIKNQEDKKENITANPIDTRSDITITTNTLDTCIIMTSTTSPTSTLTTTTTTTTPTTRTFIAAPITPTTPTTPINIPITSHTYNACPPRDITSRRPEDLDITPVKMRPKSKLPSPSPPSRLYTTASSMLKNTSPPARRATSPKIKRRPHVFKSKPANSSRPTSPVANTKTELTENNSINITIEKNKNGFGFCVRGIRVYIGNTNNYTTNHLVTAVTRDSPAERAGLVESQLITHINAEEIRGFSLTEVTALLAHNKKITLTILSLDESTIKKDSKKRNFMLGIRFVKKSETLKAAMNNKKQKRSSGLFAKLPFGIPHRTSSASSTSSEKGHTRVASISSVSSGGASSPLAVQQSSPGHLKIKSLHRRYPAPVSPLARTPSPSSLYRSTSLTLTQQKDNHLMPPLNPTTANSFTKMATKKFGSKVLPQQTTAYNIHSRVGRSRSQTNTDPKDLHTHTKSFDNTTTHYHQSQLPCSPLADSRSLSPDTQIIKTRPRSATASIKSPQRYSNPGVINTSNSDL